MDKQSKAEAEKIATDKAEVKAEAAHVADIAKAEKGVVDANAKLAAAKVITDPDYCPRCQAPALKGKPGVPYKCARCMDVK